MKRNRLLVTALMMLAGQASARGMEHTLVTGTYAPLAELTASVSVLEQVQIQSLNKRSLSEVLQTLPGLLVEQQGGPGGLTAVSIRGAESNFTLVLLDGVPVNDPTNSRGGGFDFANLNPALVERIEVVRGAQSAVYGSDALAGVINIITHRPDAGHQLQLAGEWGKDDFSNYSLGVRGAAGQWDYSLAYAYRDDGEPVPGSTRESDNVRLRVGWEPAQGHRLELGYRYLDGDRTSYPEQSGGPLLAATDDLDSSRYRDEVYSLSWQASLSDAWTSYFSVDRFQHAEDYGSPGIVPYTEVPPNGADTDFRQDRLRWVNTMALGRASEVNLGADYRDEQADSVGYIDFFGIVFPADYRLQRSTRGIFLNGSSEVFDGLLLQGSVRHDDPDGIDAETTFNVGGRYRLTESLSLSANWGDAFKLPSFAALGHPLVGNPDLLPEKARNRDLGLGWQVSASLHLAATGFLNEYEDLVDFDSETFRNVNRKHIETRGVELEMAWQVQPSLSLRGQLTYTDIDVKGEDTVLTGRPDWSGSLTGTWQLSPAWQTTLDYRYTGQQWSSTRFPGYEQSLELDDFHRLDWVVQWAFASDWQARLSADNLLAEEYQTSIGFAAPGRAFRLGIQYTL
ncbi:TonB-dependent receptor [Seongchinamella unica]|uniref:TonB-dependent receptor n=1 Tax=Seongchinamella unica TaxID=2547392 RepID=A0A4R5LT36_9GAMM|nr:TonB-dependent receptor [Seongchinamella unica]TDG14099.1 TonB-dependent receptor [Seongchinamella unica]